MIIELGHFMLILALVFAVMQVILPSIGLLGNNSSLYLLAKPLTIGQFLLVLISFLVLSYGFLSDDFSILYVANNSNILLPTIYKISALWGAHEGSLLLWSLILSSWSLAVSLMSKSLPDKMLMRILVVLGFISIGFLAFLLFTSNPFERIFPIPINGRELNPLLQDFGLAVHPPMLYMGYVGMAVPFAFVISALIEGKLDSTWISWSRPWTLAAMVFLTMGIVLGSWWAYYELGWGGWWFWDPVENASFMPWLVAVALVHSLSVAEKRAAFKHWSVLLAIGGFSLSLLGTFLVRSGVLTSVHSFASDPARGVFILIFLVIVIGGSFALYAYRSSVMTSNNSFSLVSRETGLLMNNILLVVAMFSVLLGTLYPLFLDAFNLGKISVGAPYFMAVFVPIMFPVVILLAVTPFLRWKDDLAINVFYRLKFVWLAFAVIFVILFIIYQHNIAVLLAVLLFTWVVMHSLLLLIQRIKTSNNINKSFIGMIVAHIGIAVFALGATITTQFGIEKDVKLNINETMSLASYNLVFKGVKDFQGANYSGNKGRLEVFKNDKLLYILEPEKRQYSTGMPMTEASIQTNVFDDIYVSLGENLGNGSWSVRVYYKPFIRLIWLGGILIAIGGFIALLARRQRVIVRH